MRTDRELLSSRRPRAQPATPRPGASTHSHTRDRRRAPGHRQGGNERDEDGRGDGLSTGWGGRGDAGTCTTPGDGRVRQRHRSPPIGRQSRSETDSGHRPGCHRHRGIAATGAAGTVERDPQGPCRVIGQFPKNRNRHSSRGWAVPLPDTYLRHEHPSSQTGNRPRRLVAAAVDPAAN